MRVTPKFIAAAAVFVAVLTAGGHAFGGARKRPTVGDRVLMVKFEVHLHRCTSCAQKIANVLYNMEGVIDSRAVAGADAAVVLFEAGQADLEKMKERVRLAGFNARIAWGPLAATSDGRPEQFSSRELGQVRPVLSEVRAMRKLADLRAKKAKFEREHGVEKPRAEAVAEAKAAPAKPDVATPAELRGHSDNAVAKGRVTRESLAGKPVAPVVMQDPPLRSTIPALTKPVPGTPPVAQGPAVLDSSDNGVANIPREQVEEPQAPEELPAAPLALPPQRRAPAQVLPQAAPARQRYEPTPDVEPLPLGNENSGTSETGF